MGNNQAVQLEKGDHIYVYREGMQYYHHGIYVGEIETVKYVIHFTSTGNKSSTSSILETVACEKCGFRATLHFGVVKTCLDCFLLGGSLEVKKHRNTKPCNEVIKTANNLLVEGFGEYHLVNNNCEHFATFCKTGERHSEQVATATAKVATGLLATGLVVGLLGSSHTNSPNKRRS